MTGPRNIHAIRSQHGPKRLSVADKHAIVSQLKRLGGGGKPLGVHVRAVAQRHGVSVKTVYKWLADPRLAGDTPQPCSRKRFEVTIEHLTVVAQEQNLFTAWEKMRDAGLLDCSYRTFARAITERTDPTLVAAAIAGHKGLVNNRLYLKWVPPHRCHTYHVDHTLLDLWVWPSHKHRSPIRPHVTVVVDGYSGLLHAVPWNADVNGDMIAAALVDATVEHDYHGVKVGGQPEQVILDNAAAHFGPAMRAAVERVGWIPAPTAAYSSWQNGKAERAIGMLNKRLANRAPGATNSGTTHTGAPRNVARLPKDIKPDDVWSWKAFTLALQAEVDDINTTIKMKRLGGLTRLQAYDRDPTERRPMSQAEATHAMLTSGAHTYTATKNGINFGGVDYVGSCLEYGRKYLIRFLPTQRDFIEVFDLAGEHLGTAYDPDRIPKDQRSAFMAERARQEYDAQAIEFGVRAHRRHQAAADNAGVNYEDPAATEQSGQQLSAPERPLKAVDRLDRSKGENTVPKTPASRPQQPRVPASEPPPETSVPDTMRSRLEAIHGNGLQSPSKTPKPKHDNSKDKA